jgi:predicted nuclease of predicted toxin-antitoxin system
MSVASGEGDRAVPRLLFDQNLAPTLILKLVDLYPGSAHVREFGLAAADDEAVWSHAVAHGATIVTKDDDFRQRSLLHEAPRR